MSDQNTYSETDVKQARRVPGMPMVLAGSTLLVVLLLGAAFVWGWS